MSRPDAEARRATFRHFRGPWLAVILGLVCFANSLGNGFTYDDNAIVRKNPRIRSLTNVRGIWLRDWWYRHTDDEPIVDPSRDRLYRPLTLFSFALNYAAHALRPLGYHLVNVLLHAGVCFLVWQFAWRLFRDRAIAFIAAVLFAVHPLHSEAVAGIVGRAEVLAAGLMLLGLLALLPPEGLPGTKRALLAAPAFFGALLAKETAVCFPAIALVVLHAVSRKRRPPRRWWLLHVAWLLLPLVVYIPLRYAALEEHLVRERIRSILFVPLHEADLAVRVHGPLTILGYYARLLIVPSRLSCDYGVAVFDPRRGPELMTLVGVVAVALLVAGLAGYRRRSPTWRRLAILAALFLASYALISNTVMLIGVSVAERLMYWPSVPALLVVAVGVVGFWRKYCGPGQPLARRAGLLRTFGILLIVALGVRSVVRNSDWKSDEQLFATDLRTYPDNAHLSNALAQILLWRAQQTPEAAQRDELITQAERLLTRALEIESRFPHALRQLGLAYLLRGEQERALVYLNRALMLNPLDKQAQGYIARLRGDAAVSAARVAELRREVARRPDDAPLRLELGQLLIGLGRNYEALQQCTEAKRLAPEDVTTLRTYGEALVLNLQEREALAVFRRVLTLEPADWETHANLSKLLADSDPAGALHHAQVAHDLRPDDLRTQVNLAEAYALSGRTEDAIRQLRKTAQNLKPADPFRQAVIDRIAELERKLP